MKDLNQAGIEIAKELTKSRDEKVKRIRQRINTGSYKVQSLRVAQAIVTNNPGNGDKK
jgi:anti-sigma28 factor (negative regulator of flagellin synthesis)